MEGAFLFKMDMKHFALILFLVSALSLRAQFKVEVTEARALKDRLLLELAFSEDGETRWTTSVWTKQAWQEAFLNRKNFQVSIKELYHLELQGKHLVVVELLKPGGRFTVLEYSEKEAFQSHLRRWATNPDADVAVKRVTALPQNPSRMRKQKIVPQRRANPVATVYRGHLRQLMPFPLKNSIKK